MTAEERKRREVLQHGDALERLEALLGQKNVKRATLRNAAAEAIRQARVMRWKLEEADRARVKL